MPNNNHKIIKDAFFNSYKSFMDFLRLPNERNVMYCILILRKPMPNNLTDVQIIINGMHSNDNNYNYNFNSNVLLSNTEAKNLVDDIRIDFKNNHYISYSTVNMADSIQRLQNTNYSLNIKLLNNDELKEAMYFNNEINKDGTRHKALKRN